MRKEEGKIQREIKRDKNVSKKEKEKMQRWKSEG